MRAILLTNPVHIHTDAVGQHCCSLLLLKPLSGSFFIVLVLVGRTVVVNSTQITLVWSCGNVRAERLNAGTTGVPTEHFLLLISFL